MGNPLFAGSASPSIFQVFGDVPDDFTFSYPICLRLQAFSFTGVLTVGKEKAGWVQATDPLDTDFESDLSSWLWDRYLIAALRIDALRIPANIMAAHQRARERAWCAGRHRERCPAVVRHEITEQLECELANRALPKMTVIPWVWDLSNGRLVFFSQSDRPRTVFQRLFKVTFGLPAIQQSILDFCPAKSRNALLTTAGTDFRSVETVT